MRHAIALCCALLLPAGLSAAAEPVRATRLLSTRTTASGQPIVLPQRDAELIVTRLVIPPGTTLPTHEHPFQRYAYVVAGHLAVTLADTGQVFDYRAGDFVVEVRNQWHYGTAVGDQPVVLLVIDQVEAGHANTILKPAR